ncbi:unnamed protein product [Soboliphyme baturini]|uniref:Beta-lactamase domain-containing protein n=1 Tax=Soboliphyme baturini TaxID=241478 RepID=A0A183IB11_9BILA|nr:unnamed protein product [Soboliphyme baturini]
MDMVPRRDKSGSEGASGKCQRPFQRLFNEERRQSSKATVLPRERAKIRSARPTNNCSPRLVHLLFPHHSLYTNTQTRPTESERSQRFGVTGFTTTARVHKQSPCIDDGCFKALSPSPSSSSTATHGSELSPTGGGAIDRTIGIGWPADRSTGVVNTFVVYAQSAGDRFFDQVEIVTHGVAKTFAGSRLAQRLIGQDQAFLERSPRKMPWRMSDRPLSIASNRDQHGKLLP